jgi:hypothetical protein
MEPMNRWGAKQLGRRRDSGVFVFAVAQQELQVDANKSVLTFRLAGGLQAGVAYERKKGEAALSPGTTVLVLGVDSGAGIRVPSPEHGPIDYHLLRTPLVFPLGNTTASPPGNPPPVAPAAPATPAAADAKG